MNNADKISSKFEWYDEYAEIMKTYVSPPSLTNTRMVSDIAPVPLSRVFLIMQEYQKHSSVWRAFLKVGVTGNFNNQESNMLGGFQHFLEVKYGAEDWGTTAAAAKIRKWVSGHYKGLDDPRLAADLLEKEFVIEG